MENGLEGLQGVNLEQLAADGRSVGYKTRDSAEFGVFHAQTTTQRLAGYFTTPEFKEKLEWVTKNV